MPASLIRGRSVITHAVDRNNWNEITNGAVLQEDGIITAIGGFADLSVQHPGIPVIGTGNEILLPGFINGHHHVGLTPFQLGSPDMPLELWFVTRMVSRNLNLYLDTLYSAFEMIASGITTVQHISRLGPGQSGISGTRLQRGHPRLQRCRHAGVLFLCGARPEQAGVSGRRPVRRQSAGRSAAGDAALVRPDGTDPG